MILGFSGITGKQTNAEDDVGLGGTTGFFVKINHQRYFNRRWKNIRRIGKIVRRNGILEILNCARSSV